MDPTPQLASGIGLITQAALYKTAINATESMVHKKGKAKRRKRKTYA